MSYSTVIQATLTVPGASPVLVCCLRTAPSRVEREMLRAAFCDNDGADPALISAFNALDPDRAQGFPLEAIFDRSSGAARINPGIALFEISSHMVDDLHELEKQLAELDELAGTSGTVTVYVGLS